MIIGFGEVLDKASDNQNSTDNSTLSNAVS